MSAGEIQVINGVPMKLSAKSGHYTPTFDQFTNGVQSLKRQGIDLSKCKVMLYEKGKEALVPALAFLADPRARQRYAVWKFG